MQRAGSYVPHVASQLKQELLLSMEVCSFRLDLNLFCVCQVSVICLEVLSSSDFRCEIVLFSWPSYVAFLTLC